ncbi:ANTAR domain-containing protein [Actinoplanes flavus]|uniref:ANTAR domain-containing protein n=1 Tax=Actinoplanes flavus TaxID=2820290 RepID=A0ABS3UVF9_9ACTN|nr:ANTAR domain-containing protein [Actinoplanes flavus]MBO3742563.1 ANTAR domain-containing protein [Actinoplanes flavus]
MSTFGEPDKHSPGSGSEYFGRSQRCLGDSDVIGLTGELDRDALPELREWLLSAAAASTAATFVLDMSELEFIDAGCIRVVLAAHDAATSRGKRFRVEGLHGTPERVFEILGLMPGLVGRAEVPVGVGGAPVNEADGQAAAHDDVPLVERTRRADHWQSRADERERLADERERSADERDALADERERMADRQERELTRPGHRPASGVTPSGDTDDRDDGADTDATELAVRRAEAAVRRAEAELERTRQAAARAQRRAALRVARADRAVAASAAAGTVDGEEVAWAVDRRDFVAAERDRLADERDGIADRRDQAAARRERLADEREREILDHEKCMSGPSPAGRQPGPTQDGASGGRPRATAERPAELWGPPAYGPMLLSSFAPLARQLFDNDDLTAAIARVLKFTVEAMAGCDCASATLIQRGRVVESVNSSADAAELDEIQFATGIGPAAEALYGEEPVHVPDLAAGRRWPALTATAAELGIRSALSFGLYVNRPAQWSALGTFTLYATAPDAFSDDDHDFGCILAAYLAVAVATARRQDEVDRREAALHRALSTRDVIGQAKGILMERQRLSAGEAFDLLRRVSQRLNRKLADVAEHLTETGEVPA